MHTTLTHLTGHVYRVRATSGFCGSCRQLHYAVKHLYQWSHAAWLLGLWPPPLPVLPRSLLPVCFFFGGCLCCSLVIAFCYIYPYLRATSNLSCPTMVFQNVYIRNILFSFIYRCLSHYYKVKGFEFDSVQVTTISQAHIQVTVVIWFSWLTNTLPDLCWLVIAVSADWIVYFECLHRHWLFDNYLQVTLL